MRYVVAGFITPTDSSLEQELYAIKNEDMRRIGCLLRAIHKFVFGGMEDFRIVFNCSLAIDDDGYPMPYVKLRYSDHEKGNLRKLINTILNETDLDVDEPRLEKMKPNLKRQAKYLADKNGIADESVA